MLTRAKLIDRSTDDEVHSRGPRWSASLEAIHGIAKSAPEWFELRLEMLPITDTRGVQGLANLLGAGRTDRPLGFMKREARGLELQPAMGQQAADVRLRIAYQFFVTQMQHLAGQHRVPMVHEAQVTPVVAT